MSAPPFIRVADACDTWRTCACCHRAIRVDVEVAVCSVCSTFSHAECWTDNGGCVVVGCAAAPAPSPPASDAYGPAPPPVGSRGLSPLVAGVIALVIVGATAAGVVAVTRGGGSDEPDGTPAVVESSGAQPSEVSAGMATSEPVVTQEPDSTPAAAPAAPAGRGPESMLESHFADIEDGKLRRAYGNLIAGEATTASESGWVQEQRTDGLYDYDLDVDVKYAGSGKAIARVVTCHTEARGSGCYDWTGFWRVQQIEGRWRIAKSKLARAGCG